MSSSTFAVEHIGNCAVVFLTGDIDLTVVGATRDCYDDAIALARVPHLIVDLSGVTFMDSSGLSALAAVLKRIEARGGTLSVAGASERMLMLLRIVRLDDSIEVLPSAGLRSGSHTTGGRPLVPSGR